jgi:hypothetical protein
MQQEGPTRCQACSVPCSFEIPSFQNSEKINVSALEITQSLVLCYTATENRHFHLWIALLAKSYAILGLLPLTSTQRLLPWLLEDPENKFHSSHVATFHLQSLNTVLS